MYRVLLQKDKKALGVLPQIFKTGSEIEDHIDKHYPGHFIATTFAGSQQEKDWIDKHGIHMENLKEERGRVSTNSFRKSIKQKGWNASEAYNNAADIFHSEKNYPQKNTIGKCRNFIKSGLQKYLDL